MHCKCMLQSSPELVNLRGGSNLTALHESAREGHAIVVRWLLDHNADIEAMDNGYRRPLHEAASFGRVEATVALLEVAI